MPPRRITPELIRQAIHMRLLGTMTTGRPPSWDVVAEAIGCSDRHLLRVRQRPEWTEALREAGGRDDEELLCQARARLAMLVASPDEKVALQAAKQILDAVVGTRVELLARHDHSITVSSFDVSQLSADQLRTVAREVAAASGVGPSRALPAATSDPQEILEGEVVTDE